MPDALEFAAAFPLKDVRLFHKNARRGNVEAIAKSLTIHGQYRAVVINKGTHTGRKNEVLAGNHTVKAARELGWKSIAANLVDFDEDQAMRVVLIDNALSDKATYDIPELTDILQNLDDLEGTGYTEEDLDKLLNGLEDGEESDPKDSETEEAYHGRYELVVECSDEDHQRELYEKFQAEGLTVRVLSL